MSLTGNEVKDLALGLFRAESERDKQYKVGASQISDPCTRHLAKALLAQRETDIKYWLGGKIGTSVHLFLENAIETASDPIFADAMVEKKITLGSLDNYGTVSSKPDLYLPSVRHLIDWKTSTRAKTKKLQDVVAGLKQDDETEYTLKKYIGQTQLYAWGLTKGSDPVEKISLVFINRDGTYENDIWEYTFDYDESIAVALWRRLEYLWNELEDGVHPDNYAPNPNCYKCNIGI